ncbi:MAG: hypothetical protein JWR60_3666 [Polaromonas sp.]|nr:hypothetical protein [Polaromonas sp.]
MATPNYSYEKRQKELAKKRKKEDKLKRKGEGRPDDELTEDGAPKPETTGDVQQSGMPAADSAP